VSELRYPLPLKLIAAQGANFARRKPVSIDQFTRDIVAMMDPRPLLLGLSHLPPSARFILAANHFQRKGMWILHPAAALTHAVREHYGPGDPPVRWVVTANWPRIKLGPLAFRSPGDLLLPRVADVWSCYSVSFHGTNPVYTAKSLRKILRETPRSARPLGLFPEGVAGQAGKVNEPLPGVGRLIGHLAKSGVPVVPVGVAATDRLVVRFGPVISEPELLHAPDAAKLVMDRIGQLI
jgi:1-acyl-sn-glycerol-3-phosphate acyltransferase